MFQNWMPFFGHSSGWSGTAVQTERTMYLIAGTAETFTNLRQTDPMRMGGTFARCVAVPSSALLSMARRTADATGWREIPGYDGAYQISWEGQVRTWRWRGTHYLKEPKLLVQFVRKPRGNNKRSARRYVKLTDPQGRTKDVAVIRLMVEVWFGGYPPGKVAYHKNGNTADHCYTNIGFITPRELGKLTGAKSRRMPVAKVNKAGEVVAFYSSARKAAKANHMSYQAVLDRCHGKIKKPFAIDGYTYRFEK